MRNRCEPVLILFQLALTLPACNVVKMQARHTQKEFKKAGLTERTYHFPEPTTH